MEQKYTKLEIIRVIFFRIVTYFVVELLFIAILCYYYFRVGDSPSLLLWAGFGLAALWSLLSNTHDAQEGALEVFKEGSLYLSDALTGAALLGIIVLLTWSENWLIPTMFAATMATHLRYAYMIMGWTVIEQRKKDNDKSAD